MTKKQAREAYKEIQLTKQEKAVLFENILSASGRIAPDGKDRTMRKRNYRPAVIAAIVALMMLLMGCAWVVLKLDDIIIGEEHYQHTYLDEGTGELITEPMEVRNIISLQGIEGTPNYQAAAEWYAFEQDYLINHWEQITNDFQEPEDYQAYCPGNQEMVDKLDEICAKYGLQLAGKRVFVESWHGDLMLKILGIENLVTNTVRDVVHLGGYFYSCGNFKHSFECYLNSSETSWKHSVLATVFYHDKGYLDTLYWSVDTQDLRQWNYTCSDGTQVLIVTTGNRGEIMCNREDAFLSVGFFTVHIGDDGAEEHMSDWDLELIAEAIDFSLKPRRPDMEVAQKQLDEVTLAYEATKPEQKPLSYGDMVQWQINNRYSDKPLYYCLYDFGGEGSVELLLGYADEFTFMFSTNADGEVVPGSPTEEDWAELEALWPTLDIIPVEEFPFDEY